VQQLTPDRLVGRVAFVTGAAGDIGGAIAMRAAADGATVVLSDLATTSDRLAATADACRAAGAPDVQLCPLDVTDEAAVAAAVADVVARVGPPDAIVTSAGYQGAFEPMPGYPIDDLRSVLEVNVVGTFTVVQTCAAALLAARRPGSVVVVASMAGVSGAPNMAAYSASKAAVLGLCRSAAKDLAGADIRVNAVSPAFIGPGAMWDRQVALQAATPSPYYADTVDEVAAQMIGMVPLRRYGTVQEVAAVVGFLLSDDASYLTGDQHGDLRRFRVSAAGPEAGRRACVVGSLRCRLGTAGSPLDRWMPVGGGCEGGTDERRCRHGQGQLPLEHWRHLRARRTHAGPTSTAACL
jgi:NAD(P)-dependent dehydrogenase (short-subunit alcohol dehydrogenase family)